MKADAEWDALSAKVEGREEFYKGIQVVAFVATIDMPEEPQAQQVCVIVTFQSLNVCCNLCATW